MKRCVTTFLLAISCAAALADDPAAGGNQADAGKPAEAGKQAEEAKPAEQKPAPLEFRHLDLKHYMMLNNQDCSFPNGEEDVYGRIALQIVFDYANTDTFDYEAVKTFVKYNKKWPVAAFAVANTDRLNNKKLEKFKAKFAPGEWDRMEIPVYYKGAGLQLPEESAPKKIPWYYVCSIDGQLAYSGDSLADAQSKVEVLAKGLPQPDPVFAYAKPVNLKTDIEKILAKPGVSYAPLLAFLKTKAKTDDEAKNLYRGMRMAYESEVQSIRDEFWGRPGLSLARCADLVKKYPEAKTDSRIIQVQKSWGASKPEYKKLMKLELDAIAYKEAKAAQDKLAADGGTVSSSAEKKLAAAKDAIVKKAEKFSKSKDGSVMGEAEAILMEINE